MRIISWLFDRAPTADTPPPEINPTPAARARGIAVTIDDASDIEATPDPLAPAGPRRYILEPFFWMIEYTAADGAVTRRRITMLHVTERDGHRYLTARCHERRALRTFRLDRISCLISQDGEIEEADPWFDDVLAAAEFEVVATKQPGEPAKAAKDVSAYTTLRRATGPALTLLIAAARSDDYLHPAEIDAIMIYLEDEAIALRDAGEIQMIDADMFAKAERTVRRLRPSRDDLVEALTAIARFDRPRQTRLAKSLAKVARADGTVDEIEAACMAELDEIGTRKFGHGWGG